MREFLIRFDGEVALSTADIWPDGDAPDDPSPLDVKRVMEAAGRKERVLRDWDIARYVQVSVSTINDGPYPVWMDET